MQPRQNWVHYAVSTHSRPKAAGISADRYLEWVKFQHTAARRRLEKLKVIGFQPVKFQHTAARRRLVSSALGTPRPKAVSTHSRPKAAGKVLANCHLFQGGFNTQPPEGGWPLESLPKVMVICFNTQPPEGGWHVPPLQKYLHL